MTMAKPTTTTHGSAIKNHLTTSTGETQVKPKLTGFNAFMKALLMELTIFRATVKDPAQAKLKKIKVNT